MREAAFHLGGPAVYNQDMLAQTDNMQPMMEGSRLIVVIAGVGLAGVIFLLSVIFARRMSRRRTLALERDIARRRASQGLPVTDAWKASAARFVDPDRLTPEEIAQREAEDDQAVEDEADPPWDDDPQEPAEDPYGLFGDKPYEDPDPDDDEDMFGDDLAGDDDDAPLR